jgi:hypothetical protein
VSLGRTSADVYGNRIDTVEPGAREFNDRFRGTDRHTGDQLLVPPRTFEHAYVPGSAAVFDVGVAALGNETTRASDHLPVYVKLVFAADEDGGEASSGALRIVALLPNPEGGRYQPGGGHAGRRRWATRRPSAAGRCGTGRRTSSRSRVRRRRVGS